MCREKGGWTLFGRSRVGLRGCASRTFHERSGLGLHHHLLREQVGRLPECVDVGLMGC